MPSASASKFKIQPMPQSSQRDRLNIVKTNVEAALNQRANFRAQKRRSVCAPLRAAAAKTQVLIADGGGSFALGMGCENEAHGVILHMRSHRHLANELLQFYNLILGQNTVDLGFGAFGGASQYFG